MPHTIDRDKFETVEQVPLAVDIDTQTFQGVLRTPSRGIGTRNYIVLIGATSLAAGLVKAAEGMHGHRTAIWTLWLL